MIIYDILLILQYQVSTTVMDLIVVFCIVSCLYLCLRCCVSVSLPNFRWIKIYTKRKQRPSPSHNVFQIFSDKVMTVLPRSSGLAARVAKVPVNGVLWYFVILHSQRFMFKPFQSSYCTWQPITTTTFAKRAFRCSAQAVWNSLPQTVLSSDSVAVFRLRLKTFLFSQAFSSFSAH